jgi:4-amino-4-deoxychorismate lyase
MGMTIEILALLGRGVVPPDTPVACADDTGLTRGDGCFEGLRLQRAPDGSPVIGDLGAHLDRMARSAAGLDIFFDRLAWAELAATAGAAWAAQHPDQAEALAKFVLTRGRPDSLTPTGYITVSPQPGGTADWRVDGIDVVTLARGYGSEAFAGAPWLLGGVKTLSYAVNMAAQRVAAARDAHDVIFVSDDGWLLEGPTSSVVWTVGETLHTVAVGDNGILASITQQVLFDRAGDVGLLTHTGRGTVDDLLAADVVMLVASGRGPVRVRSLDGKVLPVSPAAEDVVRRCQQVTGFAPGPQFPAASVSW